MGGISLETKMKQKPNRAQMPHGMRAPALTVGDEHALCGRVVDTPLGWLLVGLRLVAVVVNQGIVFPVAETKETKKTAALVAPHVCAAWLHAWHRRHTRDAPSAKSAGWGICIG